MEKLPTTQQALNELQLQVKDSSILDIVTPLFDTVGQHDPYCPNRVSEQREYTQLMWETGELRTGEFEQIYLTLAKASLSMTIALDHRHNNGDVRTRTSMVIDRDSQVRYETNPTNGVLLSPKYEKDGMTLLEPEDPSKTVEMFKSELNHSLAVIGLDEYGQYPLRQAS